VGIKISLVPIIVRRDIGRLKNDFDALEELEALVGDAPFLPGNRQNEEAKAQLEAKMKRISSFFLSSSSFTKPMTEKKRLSVLRTPQSGLLKLSFLH
jgi:hypothetical protein